VLLVISKNKKVPNFKIQSRQITKNCILASVAFDLRLIQYSAFTIKTPEEIIEAPNI